MKRTYKCINIFAIVFILLLLLSTQSFADIYVPPENSQNRHILSEQNNAPLNPKREKKEKSKEEIKKERIYGIVGISVICISVGAVVVIVKKKEAK